MSGTALKLTPAHGVRPDLTTGKDHAVCSAAFPGCTDCDKGKRNACGQGLTGILYLAAELLHLLARCRDLLRLHGPEVLIFLLQALQILLRLSNLPLQGVILILGHLTVSQGLVCLFGGFLKSVQFFLCGLDLRLQRLIFAYFRAYFIAQIIACFSPILLIK